MKRTQIYLPEDLHRELSEQSRRKNISISAIIRARINLEVTPQTKNFRDIAMDLVREGEKLSWKGVPKDLSRKVDEVMYATDFC